MDRYIVDYYNQDGDLNHCWFDAESPEEAEEMARKVFWDIDEIIDIHKERKHH